MADTTLPLETRVNRIGELWLDPEFMASADFCAEMDTFVDAFDVAGLDCNLSYTREDHVFKAFQPVLARCAPGRLAAMTRMKFLRTGELEPRSQHWRIIRAPHHFLLAGEDERRVAHTLRFAAKTGPDALFDVTHLLLFELYGETPTRQIEMVMEAGLKALLTILNPVLETPSLEDVESLLVRFGSSSPSQERNLMVMLRGTPLARSAPVWSWLTQIADSDQADSQGLAFKVLQGADSLKFGRHLLARDWSWSRAQDFWTNHFGSEALTQATLELPFEGVAPRLGA